MGGYIDVKMRPSFSDPRERDENNGEDVDGKNEGGNEWATCVGFWIFSYR